MYIRYPHPSKIVIAGNHELTFDIQNQHRLRADYPEISLLCFEEVKSLLRNCVYLENQAFTIGGYRIYGSPCALTHGRTMAFNFNSEEIKEKWDLIPGDTDILMTHSPPYGILDVSKQGINSGCANLMRRVREVKPLVHIFGHIHESYGVAFSEGTVFINASNCIHHKPQFSPIVFDLPILQP